MYKQDDMTMTCMRVSDMHEGLLDPIYFSFFGNIKKKWKGNSRQSQG